MKEFEIVEQKDLVLKTNFEEVKASLLEALQKYKNLVVSEDTYQDAKAQQKEIAGLRNKIDAFRKDKKKELSKPIEEFEEKCRLLIALIQEVEEPIKKGIDFFDDKRRAAKRETAERLIAEAIEENGLIEKYAEKLTVDPKWTNLTATESEVKLAIWMEAEALLKDQNAERDAIEIVGNAVIDANKMIGQDVITLSPYLKQLEYGASAAEIVKQINGHRDEIIKNSLKPVEPETPTEDVRAPEPEENAPTTTTDVESAIPERMWARLYISGTQKDLGKIHDFLIQGDFSASFEFVVEGQGDE